MLFGKKKPRQPTPQFNEDDIQDEIRKRILKKSAVNSGIENSQESTKATLDALEDMVSLSREEMERIAEQVHAEFKEREDNTQLNSSRLSLIPWTILILIVVTFFLVRRGSSWYLFSGLILIFAILNHFFRKPPSN